MKKWILSLEKDSHVYVFVVMGLIMTAFPGYVGQAVPFCLTKKKYCAGDRNSIM